MLANYTCKNCGRRYKNKGSLARHLRYECGKEAQFECQFCPHKTKQKVNLLMHVQFKHPEHLMK